MSKPCPLADAFNKTFRAWFRQKFLPFIEHDIRERGSSEIQQCHLPGMVGNLEHHILQLQYDGLISRETVVELMKRTRNPICFGRALALSLPDDVQVSRVVRWVKGSLPGEKRLSRNYVFTQKEGEWDEY